MARFGRSGRRDQHRAGAAPATKAAPFTEYPPLTSEMPIQAPSRERHSAVPLSVALLNRRSVGGAVGILLSALFFILVVPAINDALQAEGLTVGVPLAVGEDLQVIPPPGWVLSDTEGDFTALTNSGAQIVITPAKAATQSVSAHIEAQATALADDPDNSWVVTSPTTFTTAAGDSGATVTAQSKDSGTQVWVIANGDLQTTLVLTAPVAVWDATIDGANQVASSVKFLPAELP